MSGPLSARVLHRTRRGRVWEELAGVSVPAIDEHKLCHGSSQAPCGLAQADVPSSPFVVCALSVRSSPGQHFKATQLPWILSLLQLSSGLQHSRLGRSKTEKIYESHSFCHPDYLMNNCAQYHRLCLAAHDRQYKETHQYASRGQVDAAYELLGRHREQCEYGIVAKRYDDLRWWHGAQIKENRIGSVAIDRLNTFATTIRPTSDCTVKHNVARGERRSVTHCQATQPITDIKRHDQSSANDLLCWYDRGFHADLSKQADSAVQRGRTVLCEKIDKFIRYQANALRRTMSSRWKAAAPSCRLSRLWNSWSSAS
nr:hypothetical protein CFP56_33407 [Quercus suber]